MPKKNRSSRAKGPSKTVVISGHQMYIDVTNGANGTKLFSAVNYQYVSPDSFGTQIAEHADRFNMYRFKQLWFEFKPSYYATATTISAATSRDANLFAFGFEADSVLTFTVTFGSIAQLRNSIQVPNTGYKNRNDNMLKCKLHKEKWFYTKDDLTDSASARQTITGILYGEARSSMTEAYQYGEIKVYYVVEFRDPCPTQGVTLASISREYRLGQTSSLQKLIHAVNCMVISGQKQSDQQALKDYLDSLSNDDYYFVTGHGRVPPCLSKQADLTEVIPSLLDLATLDDKFEIITKTPIPDDVTQKVVTECAACGMCKDSRSIG